MANIQNQSSSQLSSPGKDLAKPDAQTNHGLCADSSVSAWIKLWDAVVESNHYYNPLTEEASWVHPKDR